MSIPKNILFPVDFSDRCRTSWPAVAGMSRAFDAPVTLLHVLEIQHLATSELSQELEAIRGRIRERLRQFPVPGVKEGIVQRELAEGPAVACIVERAARMEKPLIMMPTRGHTRFRQMLLGSVTAGVLHDATGPVWTGAHTENNLDASGSFRSIVCAIDMGSGTGAVLKAAIEFSRHSSAALHVVHSVPGIDPHFSSAPALRAHAFLMDKAREDYSNLCRQAGTDVPLEIAENGGLVDGILEAVARHGAGLLIIGRGVIHGPLGRLRTNAHEIIRRSPCPVLSV